MSSSTRDKQKAGPLIAGGLLLLAGFASITIQFVHHRGTPDSADWKQAAQAAVELAEPQDGVRVHPSWTEDPLPHLLPLGNLLHRQHHPILEDFTGLDRVLILTEARKSREALSRLPFPVTELQEQDFGTISLLTVPIPKELQITADLASSLSSAKVFIEDGEEIRRCTKSPGGASFRCPSNSQSGSVQVTHLEIEHEGRRCIRAFPPAKAATLVVELPLENSLDILRVRAGLDQRAARLEKGDDVLYQIYLDEELVARVPVHAYSSIWEPHDINTRGLTSPSTLRFEVQSVAERPHHRRFCFNAWPLTTEQTAQKSTR